MLKKRVIAAALASAFCALASAQSYPERSVRIVVPYPAGGGVDIPFRLIAKLVGDTWKQPTVVENRPGGNLFIAMENIKGSPPDGYSLGTIDSQSMSINPLMFNRMPYDPDKDLTHIAVLFQFSCLLVTPPDFPANNIREFVALVKSKPGQFKFGSAGVGSVQHLIVEEFMQRAGGLQMQHIPYKGVADTLQGLMTKSIDVGSSAYVAANGLIKDGKLKALGIGSDKRLPQMPNLPTFKESGVNYNCPSWIGIAGPANMPKPVVDKIATDMSAAVASKEFNDKLVVPLGIEVVNMSGPKMEQFIRDDRADYASTVKRLNLPKQ